MLITLVLTALATAVLFVELPTIRSTADVAASGTDPRVLLVILVLNVYTPSGLTPYGWRKQQEERRSASSRTVPTGGRRATTIYPPTRSAASNTRTSGSAPTPPAIVSTATARVMIAAQRPSTGIGPVGTVN